MLEKTVQRDTDAMAHLRGGAPGANGHAKEVR
jgi:hypothetical protein